MGQGLPKMGNGSIQTRSSPEAGEACRHALVSSFEINMLRSSSTFIGGVHLTSKNTPKPGARHRHVRTSVVGRSNRVGTIVQSQRHTMPSA